jgi:hypothetical protein
MEPIEPTSILAGSAGMPNEASSPPVTSAAPPGRVWAFAIVAAIVATLASWVVGERNVEAFQPRLFLVQLLGQTSMQPTFESQNAANKKNAILAHAIYGCVLGLVMGLAGGLAAGSLQRGVIVGLGAQAAGAVVGVIAALVFLPFFYRHTVPDPNDLLSPILLHGAIWAAIGGVAAAAFACAAGCPVRLLPLAVGDACVAAFLASVVYHLLSAEVFPESRSIDPVAGWPIVRLLALSLLTSFVAIGAARGTGVGVRRAPKKQHHSAEL